MNKKQIVTTVAMSLMLLALPSIALAQQYGTLYLNDGSVLSGQIADYGGQYTVTVDDGRVFTVSRDRVQRVEMSAAPAPTPPQGAVAPPPQQQQYPQQQQQYPQQQQQYPQQQQQYPQQQQQYPQQQQPQNPLAQPVVAPAEPPRRELARRLKLNVFGHFSFGGTLEASTLFVSSSVDSEPTLGVGLRLEIPIGRFVALGPMFRFSQSDNFRDGVVGFDAGLWIKGRYVLENVLGGLEVYGGVPVGIAILFDTDGISDDLYGLGLGFRAGAQLFFTDRFGVMLEAGVTRTMYFVEDAADITVFQGTVQIGVTIAF